jgi:predicted DNA binding protein
MSRDINGLCFPSTVTCRQSVNRRPTHSRYEKMLEISFRIRHRNCPFSQISAKHPASKLWHWCNDEVALLEARGPDSDSILDELGVIAKRTRSTISKESFRGRKTGSMVALASLHCSNGKVCMLFKCRSVNREVERNHCVEIGPVLYQQGWEHHRIIAFSGEESRALFASLEGLGQNEIVSKVKLQGGAAQQALSLSLGALFDQLTEKQYQALTGALEMGYYGVPRKMTVKKMAEMRGVPRSTLEEHLHKGESKVLRAIGPYLHLYSPRGVTPNQKGEEEEKSARSMIDSPKPIISKVRVR